MHSNYTLYTLIQCAAVVVATNIELVNTTKAVQCTKQSMVQCLDVGLVCACVCVSCVNGWCVLVRNCTEEQEMYATIVNLMVGKVESDRIIL